MHLSTWTKMPASHRDAEKRAMRQYQLNDELRKQII